MPTKPLPLPHKSRRVVEGIHDEILKAEVKLREALAFSSLGNRAAAKRTLLELAEPLSRAQRAADVLLASNVNKALDILDQPPEIDPEEP